MNGSLFLRIFPLIGIIIGPVLLAIRGAEVSAIEKFCYVTMIGPLTILAISLRYAEDKRKILTDVDSTITKAKLEGTKAAYRKLLIIVVIATFILASGAAWLIFGDRQQTIGRF